MGGHIDDEAGGQSGGGILRWLASAGQFVLAWTVPLAVARVGLRWVRPRTIGPRSGIGVLARTMWVGLVFLLLSVLYFAVLTGLSVGVVIAAAAAFQLSLPPTGPSDETTRPVFQLLELLVSIPFITSLIRRPPDIDPDMATYGRYVKIRVGLWAIFFRLFGTLIVCGMALLPLSALLLAFPAINPQESVLTDTVGRMSWLRRVLMRVFAVVAGLVVLVTVLAVSVELVTRMKLPEHGSFAPIAEFFLPAPKVALGKTAREQATALAEKSVEERKFFETPLAEKLPPAMVQHWPFVVLGVYALDILLLVAVGKVPLAYNLRNVRVRWKTNLMTVVAFMFVIGLLTFLLAFVNGMNNLTENTGVPGNVFVLSDGSTDELFSNLGYGELDNIERVVVELDEKGNRLPTPVRVRAVERDGRVVRLASKETYYNINQPIPNTTPPRARFVILRTLEEPTTAAAVHNIELYPGGHWFAPAGVDDKSRIQCVLGEGVAGVLGGDVGKPRLVAGDTFRLGEMDWVVTGVMKSEGTTFGSEIWAKNFNVLTKKFGKEKYTTLVMRTDADTKEAARAMAYHLTQRYTQQKLRAFAEPDYYAELTKTNNFFLTATVLVAVVMAIGGVFGMMTTMFASIAQRIKDIGVLRLLGFKRWQVTVSFLLESITLAVIGGALGCFVAWFFADGKQSVTTLSGGGGGPGGKSFALTIDVDAEVMAMGMLFTLAMGRLGGLVPALSAMRMKILDSLR